MSKDDELRRTAHIGLNFVGNIVPTPLTGTVLEVRNAPGHSIKYCECAMKRLHTVREVFDALGGVGKIAEITETNWKQAWHWVGVADQFPAAYFKCLNDALRRKGFSAPPTLWGQKGLKPLKRAA